MLPKLPFADCRNCPLQNAVAVPSHIPEGATIAFIGEAPGYRGCRFSGVPFTSESQLYLDKFPFSGKQSSCFDKPKREATATIFWEMMHAYHPGFLVWNCIPFHPHQPQAVHKNRTPSINEINEYLWLVKETISIISPVSVVAVGRKAETALSNIKIECIAVRHPSHGGAGRFKSDMCKLFKKSNNR